MRFVEDLYYSAESYREAMRAIKRSEALTPKEYGMILQKKKKKGKRKKNG